MGVMTPTTTQDAKRHDTLKGMPSKGTSRKSFRIESELWDEFGEAAGSVHKDGRSGVLRDFIRWFLNKPGAGLPKPTLDNEAHPNNTSPS